MNIDLISKITGEEFYIIKLLTRLISNSCDIIKPYETVTYRDGKYNKISIINKCTHNISKNVFKDYRDDIRIIDIFGSFKNAELNIKSDLINLYKNYQFTIEIADKWIFKIYADLIDTEQISATSDNRLITIKDMFNKIKSIELVDKTIFKSDTVALGDYKINILFNSDDVNIDLTEVVYTGIRKMYFDGMTKIRPMPSNE